METAVNLLQKKALVTVSPSVISIKQQNRKVDFIAKPINCKLKVDGCIQIDWLCYCSSTPETGSWICNFMKFFGNWNIFSHSPYHALMITRKFRVKKCLIVRINFFRFFHFLPKNHNFFFLLWSLIPVSNFLDSIKYNALPSNHRLFRFGVSVNSSSEFILLFVGFKIILLESLFIINHR